MITQLPESEGNTIGLLVSGKINTQEEDKWIAILDELIEQQGKINILVHVDGIIDPQLHAAYDDLKWTFKNLKNMNKLAFVSNSKVLGWLVAVDSPFGKLVGISEKHFKTSDLAEAWAWVKA